MGRAPCCNGGHSVLKKGPWTHEEDQQLRSFLLRNPSTSWRLVPEKAGLLRCGKSCRLRWMNYLRPDIIRGNFSAEEENLIVELHATLGNKWSIIATHLPGRTDNEIKNLWNTRLKKFLVMKGIDPTTHQPLITPYSPDYMNQWAKSRMELAEAQIALAEYLKLKGLPQTCTNGYPLNHAEKQENGHMEMNYWVEGGFSGIKNVGGREMLKGHRVEMGEILKYGWGEEMDTGEREGFKGAVGGNPPPALDSTEIWMERDERLAY